MGLNTHFSTFVVCMSLGYFIYDLFIGVYYKVIDKLMITHHIVTSLIALSILSYNKYNNVYLYVLLVGEISNPLYIVRESIKHYQGFEKYDKPLGLVFCLLFIIARVNFTYKFVFSVQQDPIPLFLQLLMSLICKFKRAYFSSLVISNFYHSCKEPCQDM